MTQKDFAGILSHFPYQKYLFEYYIVIRQILFCDPVRNYINTNVEIWGGNIWDPEAYNLSMQFKVSTFPFIALLICQSERSVQIIDRIQGTTVLY
jgi:hypothetical protein